MSGVTGDFARANRVIAGFERMFMRGFMEHLTEALAETALDEVLTCFERSVDPYDRPWAQLRYRDGQILVDTARLRNSLHYRVTGHTFVISTDVVYAAVHNYGWPQRHIPRRQYIPDGQHPGPRFTRALEATAATMVRVEG